MKFQPRRFIVEVKRGTSRAAFTSPDSASEKFSSAEDLLFGNPAKADAAERAVLKAATARPANTKPPGRVLESLIEPPPPEIEEMPERPRRGRKLGSKNKPKIQPVPATSALAALGPSPAQVRAAPVEAPRAQSFAEDALAWRDADIAAAPAAAPPPAAEREAGAESPAGSAPIRTRLRDRSTILKRYVLDAEPKPGQPGYLRARRAARGS